MMHNTEARIAEIEVLYNELHSYRRVSTLWVSLLLKLYSKPFEWLGHDVMLAENLRF